MRTQLGSGSEWGGMWNICGFERGNLIMGVGGKHSAKKKRGGGLGDKTQSKREEAEGVETEQKKEEREE